MFGLAWPRILASDLEAAKQDPDPHQVLSSKHSGSWKMFCLPSHWPGGTSSISLWPGLHINDDWLHSTLARGYTISLHICWILCRRFYLHLDLRFWRSCSFNLRPWSSVYILFLGQSLWNLKDFSSTTTSFHLQSNRMVECFHCSLKSTLWAFLAGQDWVQYLPLVLLGLHTTPKEDSGYAPAEALYCTQLTVPGEFLEAPDLRPTDFLQKIDSAITGFLGPVPHCTCPVPKKPLPKALLNSEFVFVCEDASSPPLSQLYRGPYKVVVRKDKYFKLQIGSKLNNVSVDRLKPVFSSLASAMW